MQPRAPISRPFLLFVAVMALALLMFIAFLIEQNSRISDPNTKYNQTVNAVYATNTAVQSLIDATSTSRAADTQSP